MGRQVEVKNGENLSLHITSQEKEELKKISLRETGGNVSKLARRMVEEYIKAHAEGNDTFVLDNFVTDPAFEIMPTLAAPQDKWRKFYEGSTQKDRAQLRFYINKLGEQFSNVEFNEGAKVRVKWSKKV